jgi:hypothetical protein
MSLYGHWCDHCGGWFDLQHYDRSQDLAPHMAGAEYGDYGRLLAIEAAAQDLASAVAPLLDREVVSPFITAWEFDGYSSFDGKDAHQRIAEAHGKLAALLGAVGA